MTYLGTISKYILAAGIFAPRGRDCGPKVSPINIGL
jgi:hypothetical protein